MSKAFPNFQISTRGVAELFGAQRKKIDSLAC
jgi:hypothetical protein